MKKGVFLAVLLSFALLISGCSLFLGPGYLAVHVTDALTGEPLEGVRITVGEQEQSTDEKGEIEVLRLDKGLHTVQVSKKGYITKEEEVNITSGSHLSLEVDLTWTEGAGTISGYVTKNRGGPRVEGARVTGDGVGVAYTDADGYFEVPTLAKHTTDLFVEKEGMGGVRVQEVQVKEGSVLEYEIPMREIFNPEWSKIPPRIHVEGIEAGDVVEGDLEITVSVEAEHDPRVFYVYFGGLQRSPTEGYVPGEEEWSFVIDTTGHPNGESFVLVLAYDDNENTTLRMIPVEVDNEVVDNEAPDSIAFLRCYSVTYGKTAGFYSEGLREMFEQHNLSGDPNIYETPLGDEIKLDKVEDDLTILARLQWESAENASGYSVFRSVDGEEYKHIGNTHRLQMDDFGPHLTSGEYTYYKVIPYNTFGQGEAKHISVKPLPPHSLYLKEPSHKADGVSLSPDFSWELDVRGGTFPDDVHKQFFLRMYEATDFVVWEQEVFQESIQYPDTLNKGTTYTWDILASEVFIMYHSDAESESYAVSVAGDSMTIGSENGEFHFTTGYDK